MDLNDKSIKTLTDLGEVWRKNISLDIGPVLFRAWEMGFDVAAKLSLEYLEQLKNKREMEEIENKSTE